MTYSDQEQDSQELDNLLGYLKRTRGFDFGGYKRSSLGRRLLRRMQILGLEQNYSDYLDYLEVHPEEFTEVFNTLLINVTGFFRDRFVWDFLATDVLPNLTSPKNGDTQIRIWSAGYASGEEPIRQRCCWQKRSGSSSFASG